MQLIEHNANTTAENIALDELLLMKAEGGEIGQTLRFWESAEHAVVLGRAGRAGDDCFLEKCREEGVKVIRRLSGGGTVLQGPGCLNYSAVLSYDSNGEYADIKRSYNAILGRICRGFRGCGYRAEIMPVSDMVLGKKKISGNAQARKKRFFLHHGTLLYNFDIPKVARYLKHPVKEPDYRKGRRHGVFVVNIRLSSAELKAVVIKAFPLTGVKSSLNKAELAGMNKLVAEKYSRDEWNLAF